MLTLSYPLTSPTLTIELPDPELGNAEELDDTSIQRTTPEGVVFVFKDSNWFETEILTLSFYPIKTAKAEELRSFVNATFGKEVRLEDHEGQDWDVIITEHPLFTEEREEEYQAELVLDAKPTA